MAGLLGDWTSAWGSAMRNNGSGGGFAGLLGPSGPAQSATSFGSSDQPTDEDKKEYEQAKMRGYQGTLEQFVEEKRKRKAQGFGEGIMDTIGAVQHAPMAGRRY